MDAFYKNTPKLLPEGLVDLLPPDAEREAQAIAQFMQTFSSFGYERVKPPIVEFESSLFSGPGESLKAQTFRLMDPVSQQMMGVRADTTAQIARIGSSRLSHAPRPLRLSYAADVLRVKGTQLRPVRQFCQVGCEMIGVESCTADIEVALVGVKALADAGVTDLTIDLTVPLLFRHLCESESLSIDLISILHDLIEKRDRDTLCAGVESNGVSVPQSLLQDFVWLLDSEGEWIHNLQKISRNPLSGEAHKDIENLINTASGLREALDAFDLKTVQITVSPLEGRGFSYQTGVSFTLFSPYARGELARGGRYYVESVPEGETATGFTLYMDTVSQILPQSKEGPAIIVPSESSWEEIRSLQRQGHKVARTIRS